MKKPRTKKEVIAYFKAAIARVKREIRMKK